MGSTGDGNGGGRQGRLPSSFAAELGLRLRIGSRTEGKEKICRLPI